METSVKQAKNLQGKNNNNKIYIYIHLFIYKFYMKREKKTRK